MQEILIGVMVIFVLGSLLVGPVLGLVAVLMVRKERRRIDAIERRLMRAAEEPRPAEPPAKPSAEPAKEQPPPVAEPVKEARPPVVEAEAVSEAPFHLETFLGRKGLGWIAVVLLLFGVAFFLRHAFENDWIGPMGQISLGVIAGAGLTLFGWWCERFKGWTLFSQIVTAGGLLLLYLSTFAAFGYYTVLTRQVGGVFLLLIVAASASLSVLYNARALALMTVIGGLLVPPLLQSPHDRYPQLFIYLALLNAGVLLITYWRRWSVVSIVALLGTHSLFWTWHVRNFHPEKLGWALGFQVALLILFLAHSLAAHVVRSRLANVLDLIRLAGAAFAWFAAAYVMLEEDYEPWLGSLAIGMAAIYTAWARVTLSRRPDDARQTLVALAVAVGFTAIAVPIEADADWVALGWAAEAAALWWFGLRVRAGYALRGMAGVLAVLAVVRVLLIDTPWQTREPFLPILNTDALPSLGVAVALLSSVLAAIRRPDRLNPDESIIIRTAGLIGVLLVWIILSVETWGYFDAYAALDDTDPSRWHRLGQVALSGVWAIYASAVLTIGFWKDRAPLRWTALALYGLTIGKVFLFDMAGLDELYRIGAFLVVAVVLAAAAWSYQRFAPNSHSARSSNEEER